MCKERNEKTVTPTFLSRLSTLYCGSFCLIFHRKKTKLFLYEIKKSCRSQALKSISALYYGNGVTKVSKGKEETKEEERKNEVIENRMLHVRTGKKPLVIGSSTHVHTRLLFSFHIIIFFVVLCICLLYFIRLLFRLGRYYLGY